MYSMAPTGVSLIVYGLAGVVAMATGAWMKLRARTTAISTDGDDDQ